MDDYSPKQAASDPQLGLIRSRGWPLTKAAYVKAMCSPFDPTFPLDAEIAAAVPAWLPGEYPTSVMDLIFSEQPSTRKGPARILPAPRRPPNGVRQLDPALVDSVLARHPHLTREQAEEELRIEGA